VFFFLNTVYYRIVILSRDRITTVVILSR